MVGGMTPSPSATVHRAASNAPPAPSKWPVMLLVLLTGIRYASSPNANFNALVSCQSFNGVEVPWAFR